MENSLKHYQLHIMLGRALKEDSFKEKLKLVRFCVQNKRRGAQPCHHSHITMSGNFESTWDAIFWSHAKIQNIVIYIFFSNSHWFVARTLPMSVKILLGGISILPFAWGNEFEKEVHGTFCVLYIENSDHCPCRIQRDKALIKVILR